jgi:hypothetical protein
VLDAYAYEVDEEGFNILPVILTLYRSASLAVKELMLKPSEGVLKFINDGTIPDTE